MASNSQAYRQRSPAYYISRSRDANENLGIVVETMFGKLSKDTPPEVLYHRCDALLRLQRTTEPRLFILSTTLNAGRLCERRLGPSARSLIAYMSGASLKKGSVFFIGWRTTVLY